MEETRDCKGGLVGALSCIVAEDGLVGALSCIVAEDGLVGFAPSGALRQGAARDGGLVGSSSGVHEQRQGADGGRRTGREGSAFPQGFYQQRQGDQHQECEQMR